MLGRSLPGKIPEGPDQPGPRLRRRLTVIVSLVTGTSLLFATFRAPLASTSFFILAISAAGTWIVGSFASGQIPIRAERTSLWSVGIPALVLGIIAYLGFLAADLVGRHLPVISTALHNVLAKADAGPTALVLFVALINGLGEELFFRGALFGALEAHRPVVVSTIIYVVVTAASGNVALVVAALVMGTLFSLQRAHSGGVVASTVTHMVWSSLMLLALPR